MKYNMKQGKLLKIIEDTYRKGLKDGNSVSDISPFLLTSQVVSHEILNKSFKKEPICKCENPKYNYPEMIWCDKCGKKIPIKIT